MSTPVIRPSTCRNVLKAEGKPYPRSSCTVCGSQALYGCPYDRITQGVNRFGLDVHYFTEKLGIVLRDIDNYTPDEMARALIRLADVADSIVVKGYISDK